MDNLTHSLVGLTAAKAGLEKLSPGATALCVLAANAPDADIIVLAFGDRWTFLQHHRGITHAIIGVLVLAVVLPLIFHLVDLTWSRFRQQPPKTKLKGLLLASLIVSATHPLMDWTNNYGIRLFLPWSPKWSYGDLVFIVDPYMWLVLGGASFLLTSKSKFLKFVWAGLAAVLTFLVIASPRSNNLPNPRLIAALWVVVLVALIVIATKGVKERWGRKIACAAFALVLCYWGLLDFAHTRAIERGSEEATRIASSNGESVARLAAMPRLANPFRWDCVFETDRATYRFDLGLFDATTPGKAVRYEKPRPDLEYAVSQQRPARVFLGFARFPVMQMADPGCVTQTLVQLADLRYTEPGRSRGSFGLELTIDCPIELSGRR
jgi:inner membrane protein